MGDSHIYSSILYTTVMLSIVPNVSGASNLLAQNLSPQYKKIERPFEEMKLPASVMDTNTTNDCHIVMCSVRGDSVGLQYLRLLGIPGTDLCTHLIVRTKITNDVIDLTAILKDQNVVNQLQIFRAKFPQLELIVYLQESLDSKVSFSSYYTSPNKQQKLLASISQLMSEFVFTGVHIFLKNDVSKSSEAYETSKSQLLGFIRSVKNICDVGNWTLDATISSPYQNLIKEGFVESINHYIRYLVFYLQVDRHFTSHSLPLHGKDPSLESLLALLNERRIQKSRILVRIPFHGLFYKYENSSMANNSFVGAAAELVADRVDLDHDGFFSYSGVCETAYPGSKQCSFYQDTLAHSVFCHSRSYFLTFESTHTLKLKVQFLIDNGIRGFNVLDLYDDEYNGAWCDDEYPLLKSIAQAIRTSNSCLVLFKEKEQEPDDSRHFEENSVLYAAVTFLIVSAVAIPVFFVFFSYRKIFT